MPQLLCAVTKGICHASPPPVAALWFAGRAVERLDQFQPQELCMLAWGLASLGAANSGQFFPACAAALLADDGGSLAAHSAYGLSTLAWSFGRVCLAAVLHHLASE